MRFFVAAVLLLAALAKTSHAADVGGWFADQQKAAAQAAANPGPSTCAQSIGQAAVDTTAIKAYQAALCYLQAESPDMVAAKAWLSRSAELKYLPAERLLRSLQAAESATHGGDSHCHSLGEGRQICHGGAPPVTSTPK